MSSNTREKILKVGARAVHKKGFNGTGIQEILTAAGVPKGSFYFYFDSKEDFGLQLVDYYSDTIFARAGKILEDESMKPLDRLRKYFVGFFDIYEKNNFAYGCPIGNLSLEMADINKKFQEKLSRVFKRLKTVVTGCLDQARAEGDLPENIDPGDMADFFISSWEGALLQMKATKDPNLGKVFDRFMFEGLLAKRQ